VFTGVAWKTPMFTARLEEAGIVYTAAEIALGEAIELRVAQKDATGAREVLGAEEARIAHVERARPARSSRRIRSIGCTSRSDRARSRSSRPPKSSWEEVSSMRTVFMRLSFAFAVGLVACSKEQPAANAAPSKPAAKIELNVSAATSTRDALLALEADYERDHFVDLVFNFGSSGDLSKQIVAAPKADVFLSADEKEMDKVDQAKLVATGTRKTLLSNQLVVIEPADAPSIFTTPFEPSQLADPKVQRLSLGNVETVPAGRYAKAWLEKVGVWTEVADRVLPAVDVRAALAAVESAGAQAGIVYRTDVARSKKARIVLAVPMEQGPKIAYPVAAIAGRPTEKEARAFVDFLTAERARPAFEGCGFVFLPSLR
jgi:molybdate transport system substrate-binding protein